MTDHEFDTMFRPYHEGNFPGAGQYIGAMSREPEKKANVLAAWRRHLSPVPLAAACEASDALFELADKERPKHVADYIAWIVRRAKGEATTERLQQVAQECGRWNGREWTYKCHVGCQDTGLISVVEYDPKTIAYRVGMLMRRKVDPLDEVAALGEVAQRHPAAVRCTCDAGKRLSDRIVTFDPQRMDVWRFDTKAPPAESLPKSAFTNFLRRATGSREGF